MSTFAENLLRVKAEIANAAAAANRSPDDITLIAVSKTVAVERCQEAVAAGQVVLGENYAQELRDKARAVAGAKWHFIGPLQRNKVKYVVGTAELIHTISSVELMQAIDERAHKANLVQRCLIQVNIGAEPQKAGCAPDEIASLLSFARARAHVCIDGLMCIPPDDEGPSPYFRALSALADEHGLRERSMGMSADFPLAISAGATLVRVGTSLFGERRRPP